MNRTRRAAKLVAINVAAILTLIGLLVTGPLVVFGAYDAFRIVFPAPFADSRKDLPNYKQFDWAGQHFSDTKKVTSSYSDFVVWRLDPLSTETINIDESGLRHTVVPDTVSSYEIWMFGGSTMFGIGSNDANTIPSKLSNIAGVRVINYAQPGYHARQNLNELVSLYADQKKSQPAARTIMFYDGINDVLDKCRVENTGLGTEHEQQILSAVAIKGSSPRVVFMPALALIDQIKNAFDRRLYNSQYVCHGDPDRSDRIARSLVTDWSSAAAIARGNGDRFIAILQPVSFLSRTKLDHLDLFGDDWDEVARQYRAVYPAIRHYADEVDFEFHDLSGVFDHNEFIFIDYAHTSPNGNEYMAQALAEFLP